MDWTSEAPEGETEMGYFSTSQQEALPGGEEAKQRRVYHSIRMEGLFFGILWAN